MKIKSTLSGLQKFISSNCLYLLWFLIYFFIAWSILGGNLNAFIYTLATYGICIAIALSPVGEILLRNIEGVREIKTRQESDYLLPLFEEVLEEAKSKNNKLSDNIKLFLSDVIYVNAFAFGRETVVLTRGAVETFTEDELKGVIAHEIGHIANGDTKALLLTTIGNGIFTLIILATRIVMIVVEIISSIFDKSGAVTLVLIISRFCFEITVFIFSYLGLIILSINSRINEYNADEFALTIGYGAELTDALYLLQKISLPADLSLLEKAKASHPHLADRIARLEGKE